MLGSTVGHYRITAKLGEGGMGEVFLADDTRLDRKAAIKVLSADLASDPERHQRFLNEAKAASALSHPNVCVVYDVGETESGIPYIAMEFVEGDSLDLLVGPAGMEIAKVVNIAIQIADALDAAHASRIVHRDIKPANIILKERGQFVKILDFGVAKRMSGGGRSGADVTMDVQQTHSGQVLGTPSYMSPEQALGKEIDHRTDIFSIGVVLFELATGQKPFKGASFAETVDKIVNSSPPALARLNHDITPELERITLKCLHKAPDRRYQAARELMVDLQNLGRALELGEPTSSRHPDESTIDIRGSADTLMTEPSSLERLRNSDVILNYAAIDDQPLVEGKPGWVSELHRNLELRIEQLSGETVKVAPLSAPAGSAAMDDEILKHLSQAKAMVSVVSPPFIKSEACRSGVEGFWHGAEQTGGQWVDDKARLLKVLKTAVPTHDMPAVLSDIFAPLFGFEFFEIDPETHRIREFDETFGPNLKQRFFERVYDLAYDVCQTLKVLEQRNASSDVTSDEDELRHWVYLATTTSDIQDERDRIKRELLERGHRVLPDAVLPMMAMDAERAIKDHLAQCTIAIHLLGRHYGVTPEDSSESIPALQLRLTAAQSRQQDLQRLVWLPSTGEFGDDRQLDFISRVQEDPELHEQAEIIEGNLNLLKQDLIRRLAPPAETPQTPVVADGKAGAPKVYLICDAPDENAVEDLEDYLFGEGLEVCLPAFDGTDADAEALHRDNLLTCDAVLVYYGSAAKAWVDIKLRELLKAAGYGRPTPIQVQAVLVAPPDDRRKERYRSHQAQVIRQQQDARPLGELDEFVRSTKAACQ